MVSSNIYAIASTIQGEAGSPSGQFGVASVIYNRMQTDGFPSDAYGVVSQSGQFEGFGTGQTPNDNAIALATALDAGQPPPGGNTGNAVNFVGLANSSYGGVNGASGPSTAAMISNGTNIGGNYFSDNFGAPTAGFVAPQYAGGNVAGTSGTTAANKTSTGGGGSGSPTSASAASPSSSASGSGGSGGTTYIPSKAATICQGSAENPLNPYILTQYYITFGMLPLNSKTSGASTVGNNSGNTSANAAGTSSIAAASTAASTTIKSTSSNNYVLASTGGINDSTQKASYYNIVKLAVDTILTPTEGNPVVSQQVKMRLTIQEPCGFNFIEDVIAMGKKCGYQTAGLGVIDYFVRINFGGYDPNSGKWVYPIPFIANKNITQVEYAVAVANVQAQTNAEGTLYDFDLVFADHYSYIMREMIIMPTTLANLKTNSFGDFCDGLATALTNDKKQRTDNNIRRKYVFKYPKELGQSPFNGSGFQEALQSEGAQGGAPSNLPTGKTDVLKIIKMALANVKYSQDKFLYPTGSYDPNFTTPLTDYTIRFIYDRGTFDTKLQTWNDNTVTYIVEPFTSYSKYSLKVGDIGTYVSPNNQLKRMQDIKKRGMWVRTYNYLFTGQNSEVLNYDAVLSAFYNTALNTFIRGGNGGDTKPVAAHGLTSGAQSAIPPINNNGSTGLLSSMFGLSATTSGAIQSIISAASGSSSSGGAVSGTDLTAGSRFQGGMDENYPYDAQKLNAGSASDGASSKRDHFAYEIAKTDYLRNDLLELNNFEVKGDPIWLLSAYGSDDIDQSGGLKVGATPVERLGRVILINIFTPNQSNYMNAQFIQSGKTDTRNGAYLGGFFEVIVVRNTFANGQFTQSLQGVKLNHMDYINTLASQSGTSPTSFMQSVNNQASATNQTQQQVPTFGAPLPTTTR